VNSATESAVPTSTMFHSNYGSILLSVRGRDGHEMTMRRINLHITPGIKGNQ